MKVKLNAKGKKITTPSPPAALPVGGRGTGEALNTLGTDPTPVNSNRPFYNGTPSSHFSSSNPSTNVGKYVAPPKNIPWAAIPTSVKPTRLRSVKA